MNQAHESNRQKGKANSGHGSRHQTLSLHTPLPPGWAWGVDRNRHLLLFPPYTKAGGGGAEVGVQTSKSPAHPADSCHPRGPSLPAAHTCSRWCELYGGQQMDPSPSTLHTHSRDSRNMRHMDGAPLPTLVRHGLPAKQVAYPASRWPEAGAGEARAGLPRRGQPKGPSSSPGPLCTPTPGKCRPPSESGPHSVPGGLAPAGSLCGPATCPQHSALASCSVWTSSPVRVFNNAFTHPTALVV